MKSIHANRKEHYSALNDFNMSISYMELYSTSPGNPSEAHTHTQCEIYINICGDVSFIVENNIYPIVPGSILITRPHEYHHCIYHNDNIHKHFWILLNSDGNEDILDIFFNRNAGEGNLLLLQPDKNKELINLCNDMMNSVATGVQKYYRFFKLINILEDAEHISTTDTSVSNDILLAINYINQHLAEDLSIKEIAKHAHVSVNTLDRHFHKFFDTSPSAYIRKKRLTHAAKLLTQGYSITEASTYSGFSDYSNFIALFRKTYEVTPLQYQKQHMK